MMTPYQDIPTTELIETRRSLALLVEGTHGTEDQRAAIGELLIWATIELAERLTTLIELNDPPCFGAALESLAFDVGFPRQPSRRHAYKDMSPPTVTNGHASPTPIHGEGRAPVPVRQGGRRRG